MEPPVPRPAAGLSLRLRAATRGAHEQVDGAFPRGLDSPDAYVRYLLAVLPLAHWLHDSWRPAWSGLAGWHEPERLPRLRADLSRLGAGSAPAPKPDPAASAAEWLGGAYVLEGSAMGARLLARDLDRLQPAHPPIADARTFIDSHLADPRRWARFRHVLDALPEPEAGAALRGARRGFWLVEYQLDARGVPA